MAQVILGDRPCPTHDVLKDGGRFDPHRQAELGTYRLEQSAIVPARHLRPIPGRTSAAEVPDPPGHAPEKSRNTTVLRAGPGECAAARQSRTHRRIPARRYGDSQCHDRHAIVSNAFDPPGQLRVQIGQEDRLPVGRAGQDHGVGRPVILPFTVDGPGRLSIRSYRAGFVAQRRPGEACSVGGRIAFRSPDANLLGRTTSCRLAEQTAPRAAASTRRWRAVRANPLAHCRIVPPTRPDEGKQPGH